MSRLILILKAIRELGPRQLGLYAWYQICLRSGYLRYRTGDRRPKSGKGRLSSFALHPTLTLPNPEKMIKIIGDEGLSQGLFLADEIVAGLFRRFGGDPVPIELIPPGELAHWTDYELGRKPWGSEDPKFVWEPARFGWVFSLGQAYLLSGDERYSEIYWRYFQTFHDANPPYRGPNWASAQEVALRILAFTFAARVFESSPHSSAGRLSALAVAIADHAERIPPSILYARAQNNNHLLSEAVGLITASQVLRDHPLASRWSRLGWKWLEQGLKEQIADDGSYSQHSTNYHRLMLQLLLWLKFLGTEHEPFFRRLQPILARATNWLLRLADSESGRVPNLGPNDGAYILPLSAQPFADYRPVLQAASTAFLGQPAFEPGPWDDMSLWLGYGRSIVSSEQEPSTINHHPSTEFPGIIRSPKTHSWAYLRAAQFSGRPGHADQLHLDLWWRGLNIALDAGSYLYNAAPPWDNALTNAAVHNTLTLNDRDQMTRAGRFLYLDRADAQISRHEYADDGSWERVSAQHNGYRRWGVFHKRTVTVHQDENWIVDDCLHPDTEAAQSELQTARIHWLLPDWDFEFDQEKGSIQLRSPKGIISLTVSGQPSAIEYFLARAGEALFGPDEADPTWGWVSPTYASKDPALSFSAVVKSAFPIEFTSQWIFPE
jgi:hypothetical protein